MNFTENFVNEIKKYNHIFIYRHINPDGDALGSQYGLSEWILTNFNTKKVNIIVKESEIQNFKELFPEPINSSEENIENGLAIVLDCANQERIFGNKWKNAKSIIKIDHHPLTDEYGDLTWIASNFSSTCEMLAKLFLNMNDMKMNEKIAFYLYIGMITDTNRFSFTPLQDRTLFLASKLLEHKIDVEKIYKFLNKKTLASEKLSAYMILNKKIIGSKKDVALFVAEKNLTKKLKVDNQELRFKVNVLLTPDEINYAIYIYYDVESKTWKGSIRSKVFPINELAQKWNGGGHNKASGFKLKNKKQIKKFIKDFIKFIEQYE